MYRLLSLLGLLAILAGTYFMSRHRKKIRWQTVIWGVALQFLFAIFVLKTPAGRWFFSGINDFIVTLLSFGKEGARFVFGNLINGEVIVGTKDAQGIILQQDNLLASVGSFFAFTVLPTIIFFAALMAVLYHLGILQRVVQAVAWVMQRTMRTSGSETLSAVSNIFLGQTEAPLIVRPYVEKMTDSELMAVMTGGFATIAGGVMAAYVAMLYDKIPGIAGHLMAASIMAAPAGLYLTKMLMPETKQSPTGGKFDARTTPVETKNIVDAATTGATQGLAMALNIAAMLIAFIALVALVNGLLGWLGGIFGFEQLSLTWLFGKIFMLPALLLGVPWEDIGLVGELLGIKLALNEFVAYTMLQKFAAEGALSPRSLILASYVLCGFANLSSIGIQIGGIGAIAPSRRADLTRLGPKAMVAGFLASCTAACVAGILID
jgi:CNT family concentrative nucleoside transporter